jgi:hypothetical protein
MKTLLKEENSNGRKFADLPNIYNKNKKQTKKFGK